MQPLFTKLANLLQNTAPSQRSAARPACSTTKFGLHNWRMRVTELERLIKSQLTNCRGTASSSLLIRASFAIRHWSLIITRSVFLILIAYICCSAPGLAQTPSMTGTWNVEITLANAHHSLRFEAQDGGKGSLQLTDPAARVWSGAKPSEANWSRGEGDSVTFSGPVEFLLGNVGRDAGTLICKGKFETADLISGEVGFSPSVGDRPSKHGTFKANRRAN